MFLRYISFFNYLFMRPFNIRKMVCRFKGHPYPVVWYNMMGDEPDMTCTNCGDDLG